MATDLTFVPGKTVPMNCVGVLGGEGSVTRIVHSIRDMAHQSGEPSPIHLARAIAEAVLLDSLSEFQWRVHLRALQVADLYGEWCGGYVDPNKIANKCLDIPV